MCYQNKKSNPHSTTVANVTPSITKQSIFSFVFVTQPPIFGIKSVQPAKIYGTRDRSYKKTEIIPAIKPIINVFPIAGNFMPKVINKISIGTTKNNKQCCKGNIPKQCNIIEHTGKNPPNVNNNAN